MSNVIRFLEAMGSQQLSAAEYAVTVAALEIDAPQRQALLERDQSALNDLLGGRASVFFAICAAEEDEEEQAEVLAA
ncbi:MAG TPA: hypothetical protein VHF02_06660 [Luteimonas sp.]|nr:hypothetical protein [Luteimonas sp.]